VARAFTYLGKFGAGLDHNVTRVLVELSQRHSTLLVSDQPSFDDGLRKRPQRRDQDRRQHGGTNSDGKPGYDIAALEDVFENRHSPLLSLATIPEFALELGGINSTLVRKFLAECSTWRFTLSQSTLKYAAAVLISNREVNVR
jgi:hypothetical protein